MCRPSTAFALLLSCLVTTGCVRRTITITSNPEGALVWLNGREIGRTPVEVDFLYYGEYDVVLEKEDFEPLMTTGDARPPWWDSIPIDLAAELTPGEKHVQIAWHYELQPPKNDPQALLERARALRDKLPPPPPAAATQPGTPAATAPASGS